MKRAIVTYFVISLFFPLFFFCYRNRCYGRGHLPKKQGALIAANHVSFWDPALIGYSLAPKRACYLARDTLFHSFLGWVLTNINCYPVKRGKGNLELFKLIPRLTEEKKWVVLFPEGTRSEDGELQPGQAGIGLLVQKTNAPVIPCYIHGTYDVWGKNRKFPKLWGRTAVIFGTPLTFTHLEGLDKKRAQEQMVGEIMQAIAGLKQWYQSGAVGSPP